MSNTRVKETDSCLELTNAGQKYHSTMQFSSTLHH